jgi:hypothetical protein
MPLHLEQAEQVHPAWDKSIHRFMNNSHVNHSLALQAPPALKKMEMKRCEGEPHGIGAHAMLPQIHVWHVCGAGSEWL